MARYNVATGNIPNFPLTPIVDTQGQVKGIILQNPSAVDVFVSEDPTRLQAVAFNLLPTVGLHFPPDSTPPWMLVLEKFNGKLYARAQNPGGQIEAIIYDICPTCNPGSAAPGTL